MTFPTPIPSAPSEEGPLQVQWTAKDEETMIEHLIEHKALAGDGLNYKDTVWTAVVAALELQREEGGIKTAKKCREKWAQVSMITHKH